MFKKNPSRHSERDSESGFFVFCLQLDFGSSPEWRMVRGFSKLSLTTNFMLLSIYK